MAAAGVDIEALDAATTRRRAAALVGAAGAATAVLALVDPAARDIPLCPLRALTGLDCPACGTLRGVHALLRGDVVGALDHNLLLAFAVPLALGAVALAAAPLVGLPVRRAPLPRWGVVAVAVTAAVFAVLRNLPIDALAPLASGT
jgi:hypothetical protein